jgi:hypothetical protein
VDPVFLVFCICILSFSLKLKISVKIEFLANLVYFISFPRNLPRNPEIDNSVKAGKIK